MRIGPAMYRGGYSAYAMYVVKDVYVLGDAGVETRSRSESDEGSSCFFLSKSALSSWSEVDCEMRTYLDRAA